MAYLKIEMLLKLPKKAEWSHIIGLIQATKEKAIDSGIKANATVIPESISVFKDFLSLNCCKNQIFSKYHNKNIN